MDLVFQKYSLHNGLEVILVIAILFEDSLQYIFIPAAFRHLSADLLWTG